jgi:hypothetical protein
VPSIFTMMRVLTFFANRHSEVTDLISGIESKVQVIAKGEEPFFFQFANGKFRVRKGKLEQSDATISSEKQTLANVISGKISQEEAFNRRLIETTGSISDAMRFRLVINRTLESSRMLRFSQRVFSLAG